MANIKLKNLLTENMRRFKTKNLNERKIKAFDEKPMNILGTDVVIIDGISTGLSAAEALSTAEDTDSRLLTLKEIQSYLKKTGTYDVDDRFPENQQQWRAFIQNPSNPNNPMLWDLQKNIATSDGLPATRFLGIRMNSDVITAPSPTED